MNVIIREARQADLEKIIGIQKKAFVVQARKYDAWDIPPMTESTDDVDLSDGNLTVLVAEYGGKVAGSVRLLKDGNDAEIKRLSVSEEYQNRGIGRKLMEAVEAYADGLDRIWLFTGGQSEKNIALYRKLGFEAYKEEPFMDGFTLIYMEKFL